MTLKQIELAVWVSGVSELEYVNDLLQGVQEIVDAERVMAKLAGKKNLTTKELVEYCTARSIVKYSK